MQPTQVGSHSATRGRGWRHESLVLRQLRGALEALWPQELASPSSEGGPRAAPGTLPAFLRRFWAHCASVEHGARMPRGHEPHGPLLGEEGAPALGRAAPLGD